MTQAQTECDSYVFKLWEPGDDRALSQSASLMQTVWGESVFSSSEYGSWQYAANPSGPAIIVLVYPESPTAELAAQYVTIPSKLWDPSRKQLVPVQLSVNTATHPAHRKRQLFVKSARRAFEQAAAQGFEAVYGFPNQRSLPGFYKLGFQQTPELYLFFGILSYHSVAGRALTVLANWRNPALRSDESKSPRANDAEIEKFLGVRTTLEKHVHVPRTTEWVRWRYVNHPTSKYHFVGDSSGVFVMRLMGLASLRLCLVMDILGALTSNTIAALRAFLSEERVHVVCGLFSAEVSAVYPDLRRILTLRLPRAVSPRAFYSIYKPLQDYPVPSAPFFYSLGDIDLY